MQGLLLNDLGVTVTVEVRDRCRFQAVGLVPLVSDVVQDVGEGAVRVLLEDRRRQLGVLLAVGERPVDEVEQAVVVDVEQRRFSSTRHAILHAALFGGIDELTALVDEQLVETATEFNVEPDE